MAVIAVAMAYLYQNELMAKENQDYPVQEDCEVPFVLYFSKRI
jgi:hypothetical protein